MTKNKVKNISFCFDLASINLLYYCNKAYCQMAIASKFSASATLPL